jgi:hypothetical protein
MTTNTFEVLSVPSPAMPRGARVAAELFLRASRWLSSRPAQRAATPAEEAAAVRNFAYRVRTTDPGFAADLFAAADRHEMASESVHVAPRLPVVTPR